MKLYQFPISHYCEKIRWALDYKEIKHEIASLTPGLHMFRIPKIAPRSSVPVLVDGCDVLQGSSVIISYLDDKFPEKLLTPLDKEEKEEAFYWEKYADEEIGVSLRCFFYHYLLDHRKIVIPMLTHGRPFQQKLIFRTMFFKVRKIMRKKMKINAETATMSRAKLLLAIERITKHLENREFMVGNAFSRADLSVAALLAPAYQPEQYGLKWPLVIPKELQNFRDEVMPKLKNVIKIYNDYR